MERTRRSLSRERSPSLTMNSLRSQIEQQQTTLSSLTDHITSFNQSITSTAGTSDAGGNALVRLQFLDDRFSPLESSAERNKNIWDTLSREVNDLRQHLVATMETCTGATSHSSRRSES